ncbi:hypothetical protein OUZ56_024618 [Daphnia magna]|uniref:Uncharacterized protein n=1 Tax=Daphnia magna TaxID=35525 RepID=A0ABR0B139_9CRUS|nr:hypothetical protein OUZ56_024618 [Daphnia magna]
MKVVFSLNSSSSSICQYPEARSNVENYLCPISKSKTSSIRGNFPLFFSSMSGRTDSTAAVLIGSEATLIEAIVSTGFLEGLEIRRVPNTPPHGENDLVS